MYRNRPCLSHGEDDCVPELRAEYPRRGGSARTTPDAAYALPGLRRVRPAAVTQARTVAARTWVSPRYPRSGERLQVTCRLAQLVSERSAKRDVAIDVFASARQPPTPGLRDLGQEGDVDLGVMRGHRRRAVPQHRADARQADAMSEAWLSPQNAEARARRDGGYRRQPCSGPAARCTSRPRG